MHKVLPVLCFIFFETKEKVQLKTSYLHYFDLTNSSMWCTNLYTTILFEF